MLAILRVSPWFLLFAGCSCGMFWLNKKSRSDSWLLYSTVYILLVSGTFFFSIFTKEAYDNVKKKPIKSQLDGDAYVILGDINGLIFVAPDEYILIEKDGEKHLSKKSYTEAINKLIVLDLIRLETYPSPKPTWSYCLTKKGREFLESDLGRGKYLYPEIFCDLNNIHWWGDYKESPQKKEEFRRKYKISWEKCWDLLRAQFEEAEPGVGDYNVYYQQNSFDTVMKKIVCPWLDKVNVSVGFVGRLRLRSVLKSCR